MAERTRKPTLLGCPQSATFIAKTLIHIKCHHKDCYHYVRRSVVWDTVDHPRRRPWAKVHSYPHPPHPPNSAHVKVLGPFDPIWWLPGIFLLLKTLTSGSFDSIYIPLVDCLSRFGQFHPFPCFSASEIETESLSRLLQRRDYPRWVRWTLIMSLHISFTTHSLTMMTDDEKSQQSVTFPRIPWNWRRHSWMPY